MAINDPMNLLYQMIQQSAAGQQIPGPQANTAQDLLAALIGPVAPRSTPDPMTMQVTPSSVEGRQVTQDPWGNEAPSGPTPVWPGQPPQNQGILGKIGSILQKPGVADIIGAAAAGLAGGKRAMGAYADTRIQQKELDRRYQLQKEEADARKEQLKEMQEYRKRQEEMEAARIELARQSQQRLEQAEKERLAREAADLGLQKIPDVDDGSGNPLVAFAVTKGKFAGYVVTRDAEGNLIPLQNPKSWKKPETPGTTEGKPTYEQARVIGALQDKVEGPLSDQEIVNALRQEEIDKEKRAAERAAALTAAADARAEKKAKATQDKWTTQQIMSTSRRLQSDITSKAYQESLNGANVMAKLDPKSKNSADHIQAIYAFAKIMDPISVVREGEYATVQKYAQAWLEKFGMDVRNVFSQKGFLTPKAIENMKAVIAARMNQMETAYSSVYDEYAESAKALAIDAGMDPSVVDKHLIDLRKARGKAPEVPQGDKFGGSRRQ